jgi:NTP pyrophosphatase (non-canonical NTP hydrolase)
VTIDDKVELWRVLDEIATERVRQNTLHPGSTARELATAGRFRALAVLLEEVGEVARALLEGEPVADLRAELIQVAAVAVAWVEGIDAAPRGEP